jgi:hypothetical protein
MCTISIRGLNESAGTLTKKREPHSQNGNPSKINPERWHVFRARKTTVNEPAFHQQPTTNSPAKSHVLHPVFAKTPSKNGVTPHQKKTTAKAFPLPVGSSLPQAG